MSEEAPSAGAAPPVSLGLEQIRLGAVLSGIRSLLQALEAAPESAPLLLALTEAFQSIGQADFGLECARRAFAAAPHLCSTQAALLLAVLHSPTLTPEEVARAYFDWGSAFDPPPEAPAHPRGNRLRIGYISCNFCANPEYYFVEPLIRLHDRRRFEVFCYASLEHEDECSAACRRAADHWRDISTLDDRAAAEAIREDRIDILVECSGPFRNSRIRVLALRPAPVQVSYPSHPATTGLRAVQYRITDAVAAPPGMTERLHTESLVRLPESYVCFQGFPAAPPAKEPPVVRNGVVTYGCFNRFHKVNEQVVDVWAAILRAKPKSRLLLHQYFGGLQTPTFEYCQTLLHWFGQRGVEAERVRFAGARSTVDHFRLHDEVDIMLDPFPFSGMTTTGASLWMGVPVVTCAEGRTSAGLRRAF